jgi:hypothetical protein
MKNSVGESERNSSFLEKSFINQAVGVS